jgi:hypothetical protein
LQCAAISKVLLGKVITGSSNVTEYKNEKNSYWTLSESVIDPGCFVRPSNAEEVAEVVKILGSEIWKNEPRCKFAIRSGGYVFNAFVPRQIMETTRTWLDI